MRALDPLELVDSADFAQLALVNLVMAIACALQSVVGFGSALIAAPLLALIDPRYVPGPLLIASFVLAAGMTVRDRQGVDRRGLAWAVAGRVPGSVLGALLLVVAPQAIASSMFAGLILLGVALMLLGSRIAVLRPNPRTSFAAGLLSGVMGTVTSAGGPPLALLYQHESGPTLRGTLSSYFVIGSAISIAALVLVGKLGLPDLLRGLSILPGLLAGFASTRGLHTALDRGHTRNAVLAVSALTAALVLLKGTLLD